MSIRPWEHDSAFGRTVEDDGAVQRVPKLEFCEGIAVRTLQNPYLFLFFFAKSDDGHRRGRINGVKTADVHRRAEM